MTDKFRGDYLINPGTRTQNRVCSSCKKGFMVATGLATGSDPHLYQHKCSRCDYEHVYQEKYPRAI